MYGEACGEVTAGSDDAVGAVGIAFAGEGVDEVGEGFHRLAGD